MKIWIHVLLISILKIISMIDRIICGSVQRVAFSFVTFKVITHTEKTFKNDLHHLEGLKHCIPSENLLIVVIFRSIIDY